MAPLHKRAPSRTASQSPLTGSWPLLRDASTYACARVCTVRQQQRGDVFKLFVGQIPKTLEEDGVREGAL